MLRRRTAELRAGGVEDILLIAGTAAAVGEFSGTLGCLESRILRNPALPESASPDTRKATAR